MNLSLFLRTVGVGCCVQKQKDWLVHWPFLSLSVYSLPTEVNAYMYIDVQLAHPLTAILWLPRGFGGTYTGRTVYYWEIQPREEVLWASKRGLQLLEIGIWILVTHNTAYYLENRFQAGHTLGPWTHPLAVWGRWRKDRVGLLGALAESGALYVHLWAVPGMNILCLRVSNV